MNIEDMTAHVIEMLQNTTPDVITESTTYRATIRITNYLIEELGFDKTLATKVAFSIPMDVNNNFANDYPTEFHQLMVEFNKMLGLMWKKLKEDPRVDEVIAFEAMAPQMSVTMNY